MKEMLRNLATDGLVMMPQNFYAEAYKIGHDEHGDECIVTHPDNEKLNNYEMLAMLMDNDVLKWSITEEEFADHTVQAFCEYYMDDDECVYEGPQETDYVCVRCGNESVVKQDEGSYPLYCYECDENKYTFEVTGCPADEARCAYYDETVSDADTAFFDVVCPDGTDKELEIEASILTNETELAWLTVSAMVGKKRVFFNEQCIGEWTEDLEFEHTIGKEYITIKVKNSTKRATLQIKVQKDEPGIIFDLFKYETVPTTDAFAEREEEIVEALGYLTMEDCDAD